MDEIRQNDKTVLYSEDGVSIPMFFNNLTGKSFSGKKYMNYIRCVALEDMGFLLGTIELCMDGNVVKQGTIPNV